MFLFILLEKEIKRISLYNKYSLYTNTNILKLGSIETIDIAIFTQ